ncbi:MAG TPA: site-specific integrase, partial [Candidatus Paceibacterota bacterium]|nr:site-specific integrase [Candidatus Paceibacterota bacterium]
RFASADMSGIAEPMSSDGSRNARRVRARGRAVAKITKRVRKTKGGKQGRPEWRVRWMNPAGKEKMRCFQTRGEAERFVTKIENQKMRGEYRDPRLGRETLGNFYDTRWLPNARLRLAPSTLVLMEGHWNRYVVGRFAERRLHSITPFDLRSFSESIVEEASIYQAETALRLLRSILRAAVEDGLLARSPADEVSAPRRPHHKNRYLTEEEVAQLVAAHPMKYRAFVLIAAYGGLRFGEIVGLRLEHVDFFRRKLRVEEAIVESGGQTHLRPTKSGKTRTVTLPRFVMEALSEHMRAAPPEHGGLIFAEDDGGPVRRSNFYKRVWWPALKASGIGKMRFHDLRHTSAALAIAAGAHPKTIQMRLGHHSAAFTLDVYGGLFESLDEDLAERLDSGSSLPDDSGNDERPTKLADVIELRDRASKSRRAKNTGGRQS